MTTGWLGLGVEEEAVMELDSTLKCCMQPQDDDASDHSQRLHLPTLFVSLLLSIAIFALVFLHFNAEPLKSLLLWLAFSLLLGPFAPPSITGGDIRVGIGQPLQNFTDADTDTVDKPYRKTSKKSTHIKLDDSSAKLEDSPANWTAEIGRSGNAEPPAEDEGNKDQREWAESDDEALRRLMAKHPVGKPGRWEDISRSLDGDFDVGIVIQKAKELGVKKSRDEDSYNKFLKQRKSIDTAMLNKTNGDALDEEEAKKGKLEWSADEDLALLNALKAFPKNTTPLRWEKIAASVTGKTKSDCVKRVAELKKDFRSAKATNVIDPPTG